MNIINWNKINTFRGWGKFLAWLCHPIEMYGRDKNCYGTLCYKLSEFFQDGWRKYLPFAKPGRFLCSELIYRIPGCKVLNTFYCRTYGENQKYYSTECFLGKVKFYEISYVRNRKNVNIFADVVITTLLNEQEGKKNAEKIKTKKKLIYSGWVFTKSQAFKTLKHIIISNKKIYNPDGDNDLAYIADAFYLRSVIDPLKSILNTGKLHNKDYNIYSTHLETIYKSSKDNIERVWCYVTYLLSCINDFQAHSELAKISLICTNYLYEQEFKKNPMIDSFYSNLYKANRIKEAEKYKKSSLRDIKENKEKTIVLLNKAIDELAEKYINMPYSYKRI